MAAAKKPNKGRSTASLQKKYESVAKGKVIQWTVTTDTGSKTQVLVKKSGDLSKDLSIAQTKTKGRPGKVTNLKTVTKPAGKPITTRVSTGLGRGGLGGGMFGIKNR